MRVATPGVVDGWGVTAAMSAGVMRRWVLTSCAKAGAAMSAAERPSAAKRMIM
jgi:hypothetical protein